MTIGADYGARFNRCIATGDRAAATALLSEVQAAVASGSATGPGWAADLAKLAQVAGVPPLAKATTTPRAELLQKAAPRPALPPHLEAEAKAAIARIEAAGNKLEKVEAMQAGRAVKQRLDDFWAGQSAAAAIGIAQHQPKSSKGAWS